MASEPSARRALEGALPARPPPAMPLQPQDRERLKGLESKATQLEAAQDFAAAAKCHLESAHLLERLAPQGDAAHRQTCLKLSDKCRTRAKRAQEMAARPVMLARTMSRSQSHVIHAGLSSSLRARARGLPLPCLPSRPTLAAKSALRVASRQRERTRARPGGGARERHIDLNCTCVVRPPQGRSVRTSLTESFRFSVRRRTTCGTTASFGPSERLPLPCE